MTATGDNIDFGVIPIRQPHEINSWQPQTLANLPERPPVQPNLGNVGIIYPGKRHVFSGPPESAKTLAAYAVMLHVIRNGGTCLLIDFEMGAYDARARLLELGFSDHDLAHLHYVAPEEPAREHHLTTLVQLNVDLVVIDAAAGAYSLQGYDDNKRSDVEHFSRLYVGAFWRADTATIVIDHVVKDGESRGRYAIGSERKLGGADVHLGFEIVAPISRGQTGHYKIVTHKDRGGYLQRGRLAELELTSDPDTHQISWTFKAATHQSEDTPFRPTTLMERVSAWLSLQPEPVSRAKIEDNVKGTNVKAKRRAIDALITEGFATTSDGPRGAKLVHHTRLYKKDDPDCNPETVTPGVSQSDPILASSDHLPTTSSTSSHPVQTRSETPPQTTPSDPVRPRPDEVTTTSSTSSPPTGDGTSVADGVTHHEPDEVKALFATTTGTDAAHDLQPTHTSWLDDLTYLATIAPETDDTT